MLYFLYAVATVWGGKLHLMSEWYYAKSAAEAEITQMGKSMNPVVLAGKAFVIRKVAI